MYIWNILNHRRIKLRSDRLIAAPDHSLISPFYNSTFIPNSSPFPYKTMSYFLVELKLPQPLPAALIAVIPEQRAQVEALLQDQKLLSYALAADRSKVWAVLEAQDLAEATHLLSGFPVLRFARPSITELAFYNAPRFAFPAISLN